MFDKGIIKKPEEGCLCFGGGEPVILQDFDKLIELFLSSGYRNIRINSSGIQYSKSIEKGLKEGKISVVISPDAGTKETYERIKQVKCYDIVLENIRKYAAANPSLVKVKYIIYPNVNDTYTEIDKWFDECIKNGVKAVSFSVEQNWLQEHFPDFTPDIYQKVLYMQNRAKELNLELEIYCEALAVLRRHEEKKQEK